MHLLFFFFFFNDTATTEIYTLSLHDALPIWREGHRARRPYPRGGARGARSPRLGRPARLVRRQWRAAPGPPPPKPHPPPARNPGPPGAEGGGRRAHPGRGGARPRPVEPRPPP